MLGIWGSSYNIPKTIFYPLKGDYKRYLRRWPMPFREYTKRWTVKSHTSWVLGLGFQGLGSEDFTDRKDLGFRASGGMWEPA